MYKIQINEIMIYVNNHRIYFILSLEIVFIIASVEQLARM